MICSKTWRLCCRLDLDRSVDGMEPDFDWCGPMNQRYWLDWSRSVCSCDWLERSRPTCHFNCLDGSRPILSIWLADWSRPIRQIERVWTDLDPSVNLNGDWTITAKGLNQSHDCTNKKWSYYCNVILLVLIPWYFGTTSLLSREKVFLFFEPNIACFLCAQFPPPRKNRFCGTVVSRQALLSRRCGVVDTPSSSG